MMCRSRISDELGWVIRHQYLWRKLGKQGWTIHFEDVFIHTWDTNWLLGPSAPLSCGFLFSSSLQMEEAIMPQMWLYKLKK